MVDGSPDLVLVLVLVLSQAVLGIDFSRPLPGEEGADAGSGQAGMPVLRS